MIITSNETGHKPGDTPDEIYTTSDGEQVRPLQEAFPQLYEKGGKVSLEDLIASDTAAGAASRKTLEKMKAGIEKPITAVSATYKPKKP